MIDQRSENVVKVERDNYGLLKDTVYCFQPDGRINWRGMVKKDYLYPNKQYFPNKSVEELKAMDASQISDDKLLVSLPGIKDLAQIRGYHSVKYQAVSSTVDFASVVCSILWTGNYETNHRQVVFESTADASPLSVKGMYGNYLMAVAENRAFVRAVRNFLGVHIIGDDEVGDVQFADAEGVKIDPKKIVEGLLEQHKIKFEKLKKSFAKDEVDTESWVSLADVPANYLFSAIQKIKSGELK